MSRDSSKNIKSLLNLQGYFNQSSQNKTSDQKPTEMQEILAIVEEDSRHFMGSEESPNKLNIQLNPIQTELSNNKQPAFTPDSKAAAVTAKKPQVNKR